MKVLALLTVLLSFNQAFAEMGEVLATKSNGRINVRITGLAAKAISDKLTKAPVASKIEGSLITTTKMGKNISCTISSAMVTNAECRFTMDTNGQLSPLIQMKSQAQNNGTARTIVNGKVLNIQFSGKAAEVILEGMSQVSESGTMTLTKESGDIRCSKVREFNSKNSESCQTNIDTVGSTTSK